MTCRGLSERHFIFFNNMSYLCTKKGRSPFSVHMCLFSFSISLSLSLSTEKERDTILYSVDL